MATFRCTVIGGEVIAEKKDAFMGAAGGTEKRCSAEEPSDLRHTSLDDEDLVRYRLAVQARPADRSARVQLAAALTTRGDLAEAISTLQGGVERIPSDPWVRCMLATALMRAGLHDSAATHAEEALRLAPDEPLIRLRTAQVFAATGHRRRAQAMMPAIVAWYGSLSSRIPEPERGHFALLNEARELQADLDAD